MTLYFDNRLGDIPGSIEELSFAKNYALVAIRSWSASTEQGVISIYNSDSELIDSEVKVYFRHFSRFCSFCEEVLIIFIFRVFPRIASLGIRANRFWQYLGPMEKFQFGMAKQKVGRWSQI